VSTRGGSPRVQRSARPTRVHERAQPVVRGHQFAGFGDRGSVVLAWAPCSQDQPELPSVGLRTCWVTSILPGDVSNYTGLNLAVDKPNDADLSTDDQLI
jgi:hypothetical protein